MSAVKNDDRSGLTSSAQEALFAIVGERGFLRPSDDIERYVVEERGLYRGKPLAVLRPSSVEEVSAIVKVAVEHDLAISPQGGNTGLCGGAVAGLSGPEIVLCFDRMRAIRHIDPDNATAVFEAGVSIVEAQEAAAEHGLLFPLSYGSEGTATIGGAVSTNAGGMNVLRYGNTRDLTLGLEVVLANGEILPASRGLRKDNTGYDLKQLFIGSEGTLGIVSAAVMKLAPRPETRLTTMVAINDIANAAIFLRRLRNQFDQDLLAFEFLSSLCVAITLTHQSGLTDPISSDRPWTVLFELGGDAGEGQERLEKLLTAAFEADEICDAAIAQSLDQAARMWRLREGIIEAQKLEGASIKHDVSVAISDVAQFIDRAGKIVERIAPGCRPTPFGHLGDGNIHYNVLQPKGQERQIFLDQWEEMSGAIHDLANELGGSFSAEHGVGLLKVGDLERYCTPQEYDVMRRLKNVLDPGCIFNPGKILRRT